MGMPNGDAALDERARRVDRMVRDLERLGARVEVVACDVADETAMARLIGTCGVSRPVLRGVVHAAAAMSEAPVRALDEETLRAMLGPKVLGAELIDRLTREIDLDFLIFFSSTTALLGVAGLGHYAAANAYLDALAADRVRRGLPALSVNWGTWDEMRLASDRDRRFFAQMGLEPLSSAAALDRLGALIARGAPRKVVAAIDWAVLKPVYEAKRRRPLLREVEPLAESACARRRTSRRGGRIERRRFGLAA